MYNQRLKNCRYILLLLFYNKYNVIRVLIHILIIIYITIYKKILHLITTYNWYNYSKYI